MQQLDKGRQLKEILSSFTHLHVIPNFILWNAKDLFKYYK